MRAKNVFFYYNLFCKNATGEENGCLITVFAIILNERGLEPSASKCVPSVIKCKEDIANAATNVAPFGVKNESQECVLLQFTIFSC